MAYSSFNKTPAVTHMSIIRDVRAGKVYPVYYLMGEESYYIDRLSDFLVDAVLTPEEKAFNLITVFGADTTIQNVMDAAKGFPMGAEKQVILVKEAQNLKKIEDLESYLQQPQPTTVLIFCHKNGALDRRKKLAGRIEKVGVLYESKKVREAELPTFIANYMKRKGVAISNDAIALLAEHVGADLNRMASELDKLCIALPADSRQVGRDLVAEHIGISKEFNIFELQDAIGRKDVLKVMQIANYFDKNPKAAAVPQILSMLFRYFANLMQAYYSPERTQSGIAAWLGAPEWQVKKNVLPAMQNYKGTKVIQIISEIRRADARSKGVDNTDATPSGELMRELLYFILH